MYEDLQQVSAQLQEAMALKALPRAGWLRVGIEAPESVAAHSWGVAWLVLVLCPPALDRGRALAIAVIHDLAEVRVGDITPHDGVPAARKQAREATALRAMVAPFREAEALEGLWWDYEEGRTAEGRFVKACDKLDMALQAQVYAEVEDVDTRQFVESALRSLDVPSMRALAGG